MREQETQPNEKTGRTLLIGSLALGAVLICIGLADGQAAAVLAKAVRICMECVGIG